MSKELYCPKWIFDLCVTSTVHSFIVHDVPIDISSKKFVRGLNKRYKEIKLLEIQLGAELIIKFMGEIKRPQFEPYERLRQFLYFTLKFEKKIFTSKRKLKTLFSSALKGTKKKEYSENLTLDDFKKFIYSLRSNLVEKAPPSWTIEDEDDKDLDFLRKLLKDKYSA